MAGTEKGILREIGTDEYVDLTGGTGTVVVAMGASWCSLWSGFLDTIEGAASSFEGEPVSFVTCDVDRNAVIAILEHVTQVPTVILYHDGRRIGRIPGAMSARRLRLIVSAVLSHAEGSDNRGHGMEDTIGKT